MADIRKRQPIHGSKVQKCSKCNYHFQISPNNAQQKLNEEQLTEFKKDHGSDEKESVVPNLYPNLKEELFQCQECQDVFESNTKQLEVEGCKKQLFYLLLVCAFIVVLFSFSMLSNYTVPKAKPFDVKHRSQSPKEVELDRKCFSLEEKIYKNQNEEIWPIVLSGIKAIEKNNQPAVFLMLYSDVSAGKIAYCLAKSLSKLATEYLSIRYSAPVEVVGKLLNTRYYIEDRGRVLEMYEQKIKRNGAMILTDLQDVPAEVARSFHFMCDKFTPLVEKAAYFFILKIDSVPLDYRQWSKTAQQALKGLWGPDLQEELLNPLLTRMTQETIVILPGDSYNC